MLTRQSAWLIQFINWLISYSRLDTEGGMETSASRSSTVIADVHSDQDGNRALGTGITPQPQGFGATPNNMGASTNPFLSAPRVSTTSVADHWAAPGPSAAPHQLQGQSYPTPSAPSTSTASSYPQHLWNQQHFPQQSYQPQPQPQPQPPTQWPPAPTFAYQPHTLPGNFMPPAPLNVGYYQQGPSVSRNLVLRPEKVVCLDKYGRSGVSAFIKERLFPWRYV